MHFNTIFCSRSVIIEWLQNYLIPCPFKKLTGFDCPGCGFQRSVLDLLQGNLAKSLHQYPATIPLLFVLIYALVDARWHIDRKAHLKKGLYICTATLIAGSYLLKLSHGV